MQRLTVGEVDKINQYFEAEKSEKRDDSWVDYLPEGT